MADVLLTIANSKDGVHTILVRIEDGVEIRTCRSSNPADVVEAVFLLREQVAAVARALASIGEDGA